MSTELKDKLQAQLDQAITDQTKSNTVFIDTIAKLKAQIAASEVTYSIGDRFKDKDGKKAILMSTEMRKVVMGYLSDGTRDEDSHEVSVWTTIPSKEFDLLWGSHNFTRYWDARKQEKC